MEMINGVGVGGEDHQGLFDRFLFSPGTIVCNSDRNSEIIWRFLIAGLFSWLGWKA